MEKKTSIIVAVIIFLIAALVAGFYEVIIDKEIEENNDTKTTWKQPFCFPCSAKDFLNSGCIHPENCQGKTG